MESENTQKIRKMKFIGELAARAVTATFCPWLIKVPHGLQNWQFLTFSYLRMYLGYMLEFVHISKQHWKEHSQQVLFDDHK